MKLIWGFPGYTDGYGTNLITMECNQHYLSSIGFNVSYYSHKPGEEPALYKPSDHQLENLYKIASLTGIYGITRAQKDSLGLVQLYDLDGWYCMSYYFYWAISLYYYAKSNL